MLNSILVLRLSALGDCINTLGLLQGMQRVRPDLQLGWIIDHRFAPLFTAPQSGPLIPLIPVDLSAGLFSSWKQIHQGCRQLMPHKADALFCLQTSLKASLLSLAVPRRCSYGYDAKRAREGQSLFVRRKVVSPDNPHVLAGFTAFAKAAGLGRIQPYWDFKLSAAEKAKAADLCGGGKYVLLAPASAKIQKNWTVEGYAGIAAYAQEHGFKVVLAGSKAALELKLCAAIAAKCAFHPLNLCGKTDLRTLAALTQGASLVIAPDSAIMHLASALNVPVISLFAVHSAKRVGPWHYPDLVVSVHDELARLELKGRHEPWRYRLRDPKAMRHITLEQVINAFDIACMHYAL